LVANLPLKGVIATFFLIFFKSLSLLVEGGDSDFFIKFQKSTYLIINHTITIHTKHPSIFIIHMILQLEFLKAFGISSIRIFYIFYFIVGYCIAILLLLHRTLVH